MAWVTGVSKRAPRPTAESAMATQPQPSSKEIMTAVSLPSSASASVISLDNEAEDAAAVVCPAHRPPRRRRKKSPRDLLQEARAAEEESRIYNLTLDVHNLKQEIHDLTVHRNLLLTREQKEDPKGLAKVASIVKRYFDGFKHGLRDGDKLQREYVRSIVSEQFTIGTTAFGVDMLLEQWRRYTVVFAISSFDVKSSTPVIHNIDDTSSDLSGSGCIVFKCLSEFHGVFTRLAVDTVFPNARSCLWQLLQALGSDFICPMVFHVYFDTDGFLVRQDLSANFFIAMHGLLSGDIQMSVSFLEGSRVGEESMIDSPRHRTRAMNH